MQTSFLSLQYAMFLSLVFLAELVAGISGFVFRHEVSDATASLTLEPRKGPLTLLTRHTDLIKDTFHRTYTDAVLNYNAEDEASRAVDNLQRRVSPAPWGHGVLGESGPPGATGSWLRCCGVSNYTSWFGSVYYPSNGIPASCCFNSSDCNTNDLRNTTLAPSKVYHQGCYELVTSFMETNMAIIAGVTFGIAFSQGDEESKEPRHTTRGTSPERFTLA
ncbi:Tetraspanin-7 [Liparis tanakae]|uniref:Tetraspanin-7 n=1 Tax=Liparis tanakae TaxID=230148 RepID=A0A4Z2FL68_9TELE|nr:Tetraspanin-7 [Liparis tanakae]